MVFVYYNNNTRCVFIIIIIIMVYNTRCVFITGCKILYGHEETRDQRLIGSKTFCWKLGSSGGR